MNNRGSGLLMVVLVALALLMVGAFLVLVPASSGSASAAPGGSGASSVNATVSLARTPTGMTATITLTNNWREDLKNLRISKAALSPGSGTTVPQGSMSATPPLPINLGRLSKGASTTFTIPFTGPAPSPNTPMTADITCNYEYGWFGKGSISAGTTLLRP